MKNLLLEILVFTLVLSAFLGISGVVLDSWNETTVRILLTTIIVFVSSVLGLCCSTIYEKQKLKPLSVIGISICFISCMYFILLIWSNMTRYIFDVRIIILLISLSISSAHICLLLNINSSNQLVTTLRFYTIALSIIMDLLIIIMLYLDAEIYEQIWVVLAILIVLGTLIVPVINIITKSKFDEKKRSKYQELDDLKKLLDTSAITSEEYEKEKNSILND